jgi:hypothetical protein
LDARNWLAEVGHRSFLERRWRVRSWIVTLLVVSVCGCARYAMKDIKIVNASDKLGYDVVTVCDTCGAQSKCGSRSDSTVWANEHANKTGHLTYTRQACSNGLQPVLRGSPEHRPAAATDAHPQPDWTNPDAALTKGMTVEQARTAIGDVGLTESETQGDNTLQRTVRFTQAGKGANAGSSRNVWGQFENGKLTEVKYGPWEKK